jgi:ribonuclease E
MAKRMLIDAAHPEETRVVVLNTNRLEEFDFESSTKRQVKGNIYLAKVTRVEPSLQAAFVDYGNHRHGFLAFSEIHPDYYNIPVGDREPGEIELIAGETEAREADSETADEAGVLLAAALPEPVPIPASPEAGEDEAEAEAPESASLSIEQQEPPPASPREPTSSQGQPSTSDTVPAWTSVELGFDNVPREPEIILAPVEPVSERSASPAISIGADDLIASAEEITTVETEADRGAPAEYTSDDITSDRDAETDRAEAVETLGGDELEEAEHQRPRTGRYYKIQEVIKRRQIMLVQVTKEERGNKGAALTTYLSLAGRYCVLMPNTARGGGVSRKITSISDRRRLKDIIEELDIPEGMGVILRTAGAERSKAEIKRDYEYLLRLWNEIRELTLRSTAPALIYEEGNLIKRSIRDLYTRDIDEVLVEGEEGYRTAKAFMKMLMPSHAKRVQPYRDAQIGLFHRFQVESQIDAIHSPIVQLRSGGYVVINQTEALVAIDVNSGRSTRERNIEETALRTNLEAAEEIARQLRLRDLAGLIVIDFIDMEEHRNQGAVERKLKEALKNDRARIQVGRISAFGLLEMSRQRLRPSLVETSTQPCPHCGGTGSIRSTESTALYVLRSIEEEGMRRRSAEVCVYVPTIVALYILNQKRDSLVQLEARYGIRVLIARDDTLIPPAFRLERLRAYVAAAEPSVVSAAPLTQAPPPPDDEEEETDEILEASEAEQENGEERGRRRRRRRRRRHDEEPSSQATAAAVEASGDLPSDDEAGLAAQNRHADSGDGDADEESDLERRRRRRGRRGGRHRGRREISIEPGLEGPRPPSETVEILPVPPLDTEPGFVEASASWPVEVSAVAGESASLPALGSDPPSDLAGVATSGTGEPSGMLHEEGPEHREAPAAGEASEPAMVAAAEPEQGMPYVSETERVWETASAAAEAPPRTGTGANEHPEHGEAQGMGEASRPALAAAAESERGVPSVSETERVLEIAPPAWEPRPEPTRTGANESPEHGEAQGMGEASRPALAAAAESAHEVPSVSETERVLETVSTTQEPPPGPAHPVQTVTEKPANPRRGWWQRLMQS